MAWFPLAVIALVVLRLGAQLALEALNRGEARRHSARRPPALAEVMDEATYAKSVDYTLAKSRFASVETVYDVAVLLMLLFSGALPWLWTRFDAFAPGFTEEEERAKNDVLAPDRAAPRAAKPLAFGKDFKAALAAGEREHKRVFVDFQTTWCGPCRQMEALVYSSAPIVDAAKDLIAVALDGDEERDLVKRFGVSGYPTMILFDPAGSELRRAVGYRSIQELLEFLKP